MTKSLKLLSFALMFVFCSVNIALADPLTIIGNDFRQNSIGSNTATQILTNIFNSTVANGAAGNTFTVGQAVGGGSSIIIGNRVVQQEIGSNVAVQSATNITNSSVSNNAAGNAITFSH